MIIESIIFGAIVSFGIYKMFSPLVPSEEFQKLRRGTKQLERLNEIMAEDKEKGNLQEHVTELWKIYCEAEIDYVSHLAFLLAKKSSKPNSIEDEVAKLLDPFSPKK